MPNHTHFKSILRRTGKNDKRRHTIAVHFEDMSDVKAGDFFGWHGDLSRSADSCPSDLDTSSSLGESPDVGLLTRCEDPVVEECVHHLDDLGHALEHTFKEVDSIDALVTRLREDFDHDRVSEHRFMTSMCSAKIVRDACCRQQLEKWQKFRQGIQDLYTHSHEADSAVSGSIDSKVSSHGDNAISILLGHLGRVSILDTVLHRLDPAKDTRAFVEQWVL